MSVVFDTSYISEEFISENESIFFSHESRSKYILDLDLDYIEDVNTMRTLYDATLKELKLYFMNLDKIKLKFSLVLKDIEIFFLKKTIKEYEFGYNCYKALCG